MIGIIIHWRVQEQTRQPDLVRITITVMKNHDQRQLREEIAYLTHSSM